jgi:hypothetical protein
MSAFSFVLLERYLDGRAQDAELCFPSYPFSLKG